MNRYDVNMNLEIKQTIHYHDRENVSTRIFLFNYNPFITQNKRDWFYFNLVMSIMFVIMTWNLNELFQKWWEKYSSIYWYIL